MQCVFIYTWNLHCSWFTALLFLISLYTGRGFCRLVVRRCNKPAASWNSNVSQVHYKALHSCFWYCSKNVFKLGPSKHPIHLFIHNNSCTCAQSGHCLRQTVVLSVVDSGDRLWGTSYLMRCYVDCLWLQTVMQRAGASLLRAAFQISHDPDYGACVVALVMMAV